MSHAITSCLGLTLLVWGARPDGAAAEGLEPPDGTEVVLIRGNIPGHTDELHESVRGMHAFLKHEGPGGGVATVSGDHIPTVFRSAIMDLNWDNIETLFFYYAGHGNPRGLMPGGGLVPASTIEEVLMGVYEDLWRRERTPHENRKGNWIVILDCCHAGAIARELRGDGSISFVVFAACRADETIWNVDPRFFDDMSFYTGCFLKAVGDWDDDSLAQYASDRFGTEWATDGYEYDVEQDMLCAAAKTHDIARRWWKANSWFHRREHQQLWANGDLLVDDGQPTDLIRDSLRRFHYSRTRPAVLTPEMPEMMREGR
jgi:hypothetical protein